MRAWLARRDPRERLALGAGGMALAALLAYALVWEPFSREHARLAESVAEQRELAAWLAGVREEAAQLRRAAPAPAGLPPGQSLLAVVDRTTRTAGLGSAVRRIEPEGGDRVRVWLEGARFQVLARWLLELEGSAGVRATSASLERGRTPGQVDARLTLATGGAT
jgi:general secretion pathway protein M